MPDDLSRDVYGLLSIPVDAVDVLGVLHRIEDAVANVVAGSDIFEARKSRDKLSYPSKVFLFGGPQGVAQSACEALNAGSDGVVCVGSIYPGFCSMEEMSTDEILQTINSSKATF